MGCCATIAMRRSGSVWIGVIGFFATCLISGRIAIGKEARNNSTAERLVEEARQAELAGDTPRYFSLLRQAVRIAPDYELAHWHLSQVQFDGEWMAVEEAQRRAAADPRQARYRDQRKANGESPEGQLALARWCRKNGLNDEASFHWASVLTIEPNHEEALRAVDKRWHDGQLLSYEEIAQQKEQLRESKRAAKQWAPNIARWRREVAGSDRAKREAALEEIRSLKSIDVIPALQEVTLGRDAERKRTSAECRQIGLAFLEALAEMPTQAATESLVRHAVLSAAADVRAAAVERLKSRPQHDFVPLLLSGLVMPIESSFQVTTDPDGSVHYTHSLYREGAHTDWSVAARYSTMQHVFHGRRFVYRRPTATLEDNTPYALRAARLTATAQRSHARYSNVATALETEVSNANQAADALNSRIMPVLTATTGQSLTAPTEWWNWWNDCNEYYAHENPVDQRYYSGTSNHFYGQPYDSINYVDTPRASCFAKGTLIWTKSGQRPIESLQLGDLVLAQNVDTGELRYRPVIRRTVRPPSAILKISFGGESLRTTRGHPLWVAGVGWRMAKELGDGATLHCVTGSSRVESITPDGEEEAFNLVVADFNTYFVGETGVLVHDNTPRRPTRATVPGLGAK